MSWKRHKHYWFNPENMASPGEFTAGTAHEIPNPLHFADAKDLPGFENLADLDAFQPTVTVSTKRSPARGGGRRMGEVFPAGHLRQGFSDGARVKGEEFVQITVSDNGPGIPPDILDKIFQPFFTTKPTGKGTDLGLSVSYDSVKVHGGELKLESPPSGVSGTEFIITLPITS